MDIILWCSPLEKKLISTPRLKSESYHFHHITWPIIGISPNVNLKCGMTEQGRGVRNHRRSNFRERVEKKRDRERNDCSWNATSPQIEPPKKCNLVAYHIKLHTNDVCNDMLSWARNTSRDNWIGPEKYTITLKHHWHRLQGWVKHVSAWSEYILLSYWWVVKGQSQLEKAAVKWICIWKVDCGI